MPKKTLISVIDDDEASREAVTGLMRSLGFTAEAFSSAKDFLASPQLRDTRCLIVDINMPEMTGVALYEHLVRSGRAIPTIFMTAFPDETLRRQALASGVISYLIKPCDEDTLLTCIRSVLND